MVMHRLLITFVLLGFIPMSLLDEQKGGCMELRQPRTDDHDYHVAVMGNGVEYLLARDRADDHAEGSFGLLVPTGSLEDNFDVLGLAHLAEHAFVRGSEKYPGPADFDGFLAAHGGNFNAYTDAERTVLFFTIPGALETIWIEALDRFAAFFESPMLQGWDQDIDLINDEFATQRADPSRRFWDLLREISFGKDSAFGQLWTGNKLTLEAQNKSVVEANLRERFRSSFCAPSVKMILSGPFKSLQIMDDILNNAFRRIPMCEASRRIPKSSSPLLLGNFVQAEVRAPPELWIWLPLPNLRPHRLAQPASFLKYLLREQGANGLVATLTRELRLVSSMVPGIDSFKDVSWLYLRMGLTPAGNEELERVLNIAMNYFRSLSTMNISEVAELYESFVAARALSFDFPARQTTGAELTISLLETWSESPTSCDVVALSGGLVPKPNVSFISDLLQSFNLASEMPVNVLYASRKPCKHECQQQSWYGTQYSIAPIVVPASDTRTPSIPRPVQCSGNHIVALASSAQEPQLLAGSPDGVEVWSRTTFIGAFEQSPRFSVRMRVEMHAAFDVAAEVAALVHLEAMREKIKSEILPALGGELCSLGVSVNRVPLAAWEIKAEGIDASLLPELYSRLADAFSQPLSIHSRELLLAWRRRAMSRVADRSDEMAFDVAEEAASEIVSKDAWTRADLLKAFHTDTAFDPTPLDAETFAGAIIYIGAPGLSKDLVDAAKEAFVTKLQFQRNSQYTGAVSALPTAYKVQFGRVASIDSTNVSLINPISNDVSSAVVLSRVLAVTSVEDETAFKLLSQILDDKFSRGLRFAVEDAASIAGYIVACKFRRLSPGVVELRIVAQGTKPSSELLALLVGAQAAISIELDKLFSPGLEAEILKWSDGLARMISASPSDLGDAVDRDWNELWTLQRCFGRRDQAVEFLHSGAEVVRLTLRKVWANFLAASTVTVQVLPSNQANAASEGMVGPLRRAMLETQLWMHRDSFSVAVSCRGSDSQLGRLLGILTLFALVFGLCLTRAGILRKSHRWKDL